VNPQRRLWLFQLAAAASPALAQRAQATNPAADPAAAAADAPDPVRRGRPIRCPRDHGAHLGVRNEWWYATGWLVKAAEQAPAPAAKKAAETAVRTTAETAAETAAATAVLTAAAGTPLLGFQLTFFRSSTGLAQGIPGRFAPRQLLFAHAALTDLAGQRHLHDQRILRWNGAPDAGLNSARNSALNSALNSAPSSASRTAPGAAPDTAPHPTPGSAAVADGAVHIGSWSLRRNAADVWRTSLPARDFGLELALGASQPPLLQGDAGFSRKGPQERQASHYYSQPQLAVSGSVSLQGRATRVVGSAWLDHEWSDEILHPDAVGWDWIGMNLFDGSALTAFVLRRKDASALWAGGSWRTVGSAVRSFDADQVRWQPGRVWRSPASAASYPVDWQLATPAGSFGVRALLDAQELDSRGSTGSIYWEGLSELLDASGRRIGLGYLEMTGYAGPLKMA